MSAAVTRDTAVYLIDDGMVAERVNIERLPAEEHQHDILPPHLSPVRHLDADIVTNDPLISREWNEMIEIQRRLTRNQRALCCCGCASPEMLLSCLSIFWVIIAFYEGLRDYEVKHFEAVSVYVLAFCVFAALVSTQMRFFVMVCCGCVAQLLWNALLLFLVVSVNGERQNADEIAVPTLSYYLAMKWPNLYTLILRLINEDYYSYVCVYVLKLCFIIVVLITVVQVRRIQCIEHELRVRRRRIGILLTDLRGQLAPQGFEPVSMAFDAAEPLDAQNDAVTNTPHQHNFMHGQQFYQNYAGGGTLTLSRSISLVTATSGLSASSHSGSLVTAMEGRFSSHSLHDNNASAC